MNFKGRVDKMYQGRYKMKWKEQSYEQLLAKKVPYY